MYVCMYVHIHVCSCMYVYVHVVPVHVYYIHTYVVTYDWIHEKTDQSSPIGSRGLIQYLYTRSYPLLRLIYRCMYVGT